MAEAIKMGGGSSKILNGILEEYCAYYDDISPNTFVEYLGVGSNPPYNKQTFTTYTSINYAYTLQLNDNQLILIFTDNTSSRNVQLIPLTFDIETSTVSVGTALHYDAAGAYVSDTIKSNLGACKLSDTSFMLSYSYHASSMREYYYKTDFMVFEVLNNVITFKKRNDGVYTSQNNMGTSTTLSSYRASSGAIYVSTNKFLFVAPKGYYSAHSQYYNFTANLLSVSDTGIVTITQRLDNSGNIEGLGDNFFSLSKISDRRYVFCTYDNDTTTRVIDFALITLNATKDAISTFERKLYITNIFNSNYRSLTILAKNYDDAKYTYVPVITNMQYDVTEHNKPYVRMYCLTYDEATDNLSYTTPLASPTSWEYVGINASYVIENKAIMFFPYKLRNKPDEKTLYSFTLGGSSTLEELLNVSLTDFDYVNDTMLYLVANNTWNKSIFFTHTYNTNTLTAMHIKPFTIYSRIKAATSEIFGLVKTKCRTTKAGKVWTLLKGDNN